MVIKIQVIKHIGYKMLTSVLIVITCTGCLHKRTMGRKCCVTNCNGNYDNDSKKKVFCLPKNKKKA